MELFWQILYYAFTALYVYIAIVVLTAIVSENRNPVKTLGWIMIMILLPIVGIILYIFLGQDLRRKKIIANKLRFPNLDVHRFYGERLEKFEKVAALLSETDGARVVDGNKVDVFTTGVDAFKSLYNDIESAKEHIHVEFYIIENDRLGNRFRELLERKAREGVKVRVIYDYLGAWKLPIAWRMSLKEAGAYIHPFLAADNFFRFTLLNYRNHRKLVVVDGKVAYTAENMAVVARCGDKMLYGESKRCRSADHFSFADSDRRPLGDPHNRKIILLYCRKLVKAIHIIKTDVHRF
jgi:cardiolipin synthase